MRTVPSPAEASWTLLGAVLVACWQLSAVSVTAWQGPAPRPPPRPMINLPTDPALQGFRWRSIGPVGQGARIDDFAVDEKNPSTYYIGYAVSGVWKNDEQRHDVRRRSSTPTAPASIGDLALAPSDPNILYVGTGEANNRQTASFGNGVYKSTNALRQPISEVRERRLAGHAVDRPHRRASERSEHRRGSRRRDICTGRIPNAACS